MNIILLSTVKCFEHPYYPYAKLVSVCKEWHEILAHLGPQLKSSWYSELCVSQSKLAEHISSNYMHCHWSFKDRLIFLHRAYRLASRGHISATQYVTSRTDLFPSPQGEAELCKHRVAYLCLPPSQATDVLLLASHWPTPFAALPNIALLFRHDLLQQPLDYNAYPLLFDWSSVLTELWQFWIDDAQVVRFFQRTGLTYCFEEPECIVAELALQGRSLECLAQVQAILAQPALDKRKINLTKAQPSRQPRHRLADLDLDYLRAASAYAPNLLEYFFKQPTAYAAACEKAPVWDLLLQAPPEEAWLGIAKFIDDKTADAAEAMLDWETWEDDYRTTVGRLMTHYLRQVPLDIKHMTTALIKSANSISKVMRISLWDWFIARAPSPFPETLVRDLMEKLFGTVLIVEFSDEQYSKEVCKFRRSLKMLARHDLIMPMLRLHIELARRTLQGETPELFTLCAVHLLLAAQRHWPAEKWDLFVLKYWPILFRGFDYRALAMLAMDDLPRGLLQQQLPTEGRSALCAHYEELRRADSARAFLQRPPDNQIDSLLVDESGEELVETISKMPTAAKTLITTLVKRLQETEHSAKRQKLE